MINDQQLIELHEKHKNATNKWALVSLETGVPKEQLRNQFRRLRRQGAVENSGQPPVNIDKIKREAKKEVLDSIGSLKPDKFWAQMYTMFEQVATTLPQTVPPKPQEIDINKKKDREEMNIVVSDVHGGAKICPEETGGLGEYNWKKFLEEMEYFKRSLHSIFEIHFQSVPYETCNVFGVGDLIENVLLRASQLRTSEIGLVKQVMGVMEEMTKFIYWLAQIFPNVNVYAVAGNHGRMSKDIGYASPQDSFEYLIWHWVKERLKGCSNVKINVSDSWFMLVERMGWTFYIEHGEAFFSWLGIPFYGQQRGKMRIREMMMNYVSEHTGQTVMPHYFIFGHSHIPAYWEGIIANGAWTGVSEFSGKVLKKGTAPSQTLFSLHPKQGITFVREINLEPLRTRKINVVA